MNRRTGIIVLGIVFALMVYLGLNRFGRTADASAQTPQHGSSDAQGQVEELQKQVQALQGLVPDQAAVMTHVAYHFSNLWFAIQNENWPLADFYLGETRNNLKWAVRAKPIRKTAAGDLSLAGIAEGIDNGPFTDLKKAIDAKDRSRSVALYDQTLTACYACHKASEKPYLRPQRPVRPEVPIINFDPKATFPQ